MSNEQKGVEPSRYEIPQTVQGKIDYAIKLKELGNEYFKKGEYKKAIKQYKMIFLYVTGLGSTLADVLSNQNGSPTIASKYNDQIGPIILSANLNLSVCYLKLQMWEKAFEHAQKALQVEPDNTKALFRRGEAYLGKQDLDRAENDLNKVHKRIPQDKSVLQVLQQLEKAKMNHKKKEKNLYANMFQKLQENQEERQTEKKTGENSV